MAVGGILALSNCSYPEENNDAVIGIWSDQAVPLAKKSELRSIGQEWIFNDAYLGRYHKRENGKIIVLTDFGWSEKDGTYTISYPGIDRADDIVHMVVADHQTRLQYHSGNAMAIKQ